MANIRTTHTLQDKSSPAMRAMIKNLDQLIKQHNQADKASRQAERAASQGAQANRQAAQALLEYERQQKVATRATQQAGDSMDEASRKTDGFKASLLNVAKAAAGAVGAYKLISTAKNILSDSMSKGIDFLAFQQASTVAFTTFLGDAKLAEEYMQNMYALALQTPFAFPDLLTAGRNMIAFGMEADNTFRVITAIGDAVAAVGGGNAEMQNMADIFGQIQSQGRLTLMEVNRLSSYGINAIEMLAEASNKTASEIRKDISKGVIASGDAMEAIVSGMESKFGGLMAGVKKTWRGAVDSFNSSRRNAGIALMKDFMEPLTRSVNVLTELFKALPKYIGPAVAAFRPLIDQFNQTFGDGRMDRIFMNIGAAITVVAVAISEVAQFALWVAGIFADYWTVIEPIVWAIVAALTAYGVVMAGIWAWTMAGKVATTLITAAQWAYNSALYAFPGSWILMLFVAVIALVIYAMIAWADTTAMVIGAIVGGIYWLGAAFTNVMLFIGNLAIATAEFFANVWLEAVYAFKVFMYEAGQLFANIMQGIYNFGVSVAEWFMNAWSEASYGVQLAFYKMGDMTLSTLETIGTSMSGIVSSALGGIESMVNFAVGGLNSVIRMANKIPGVDIGEVGNVSIGRPGGVMGAALGAVRGALKAPDAHQNKTLARSTMGDDFASKNALPDKPGQVQFSRMEYASLGDAFAKGQQAGSNLSNKTSDGLKNAINTMTGLLGGPGSTGAMDVGAVPEGGSLAGKAADSPGTKEGKKGGKGGKNPTGGKLDKVGKIEDDINIADEDLKLLLEFADRKNQAAYVTLTPQVVLDGTVVREEADLNKIVGKIETALVDLTSRTVKGVF